MAAGSSSPAGASAVADALDGAKGVFPVRRLGDDAAWATVQERGWEGMVGKDDRSPGADARVAQGQGATLSGVVVRPACSAVDENIPRSHIPRQDADRTHTPAYV